jgi:RNase adaptor protein for sRNA GlmZ degradation
MGLTVRNGTDIHILSSSICWSMHVNKPTLLQPVIQVLYVSASRSSLVYSYSRTRPRHSVVLLQSLR